MINKFLDNYEFYKTFEEDGPYSNETIRKADRFLAIKKKRTKAERRQRIIINLTKKREERELSHENM